MESRYKRTNLNQKTAFAHIRGYFQTLRSFVAEGTLRIGAERQGRWETRCHCEDVGERAITFKKSPLEAIFMGICYCKIDTITSGVILKGVKQEHL